MKDKTIELYVGDCLQKLQEIDSQRVDLVLCDPPYGVTSLKWDEVIPLEPLWRELKRVLKKGGACVFTSTQPFTTQLISSNKRDFKYTLVWDKGTCGNPFIAKYQPLRHHEDIVVFSRGGGKTTYNPQGLVALNSGVRCKRHRPKVLGEIKEQKEPTYIQKMTNYPTSIIKIKAERKKRGMHPTEKPIELMRHLIKTYSNAGDTVLDFAMGSGGTGVAAVELERCFIGIEIDEGWFNIAAQKIKNSC